MPCPSLELADMRDNMAGTGEESTNETAKPVIGSLVPQKRGGALLYGNPGNGNNLSPGRPPSLVRDAYRQSFADRLPVLQAIADGEPVVAYRLDLRQILPHLACNHCGAALELRTGAPTSVRWTVQGSAAPKDRVQAIDVMGKYGLGALKEVSTEHVRAKVAATLDVIRRLVPLELAARIVDELRRIWTA